MIINLYILNPVQYENQRTESPERQDLFQISIGTWYYNMQMQINFKSTDLPTLKNIHGGDLSISWGDSKFLVRINRKILIFHEGDIHFSWRNYKNFTLKLGSLSHIHAWTFLFAFQEVNFKYKSYSEEHAHL